MKLLFICDGLGKGGKERRFVQVVKGLSIQTNIEMSLILTRNELQYDEINKYSIDIIYIDRNKNGFCKEYYTQIKDINPDVVMTWSPIPMFYFSLIRFILPNKPKYVISTAADCNFNMASWNFRLLHKMSYFCANKIVGNSYAGLNNYEVPISKRVCIYNGFDEDRLKLGDPQKLLKDEHIDNKLVVAMIATFYGGKDWDTYIYAALKVLGKRSDVVFLAVGDGPTRIGIENKVPSQYRNGIRFMGRRNDVESVLGVTNVSVLCTNSKKHAEGVSNSILESCAFGIPVIATKGGGTEEIILDNENGYIISPNDVDVLALKIETLLDNKELRIMMGDKGKNIVKEKFSLKKAVNEYTQLINNF